MENKLWIDILLERKKMDPDYEITMINPDPEFYLLEGISRENSIDEMMLVYDCSAFSEKCTFAYDEMNKVNCQAAHCGRRKRHFDFGVSAFPTVQSWRRPQTAGGVAARCRSFV